MAEDPIPIVPDQQSGWGVRGGASPIAMNVVMDGRGVVRRRPGVDLVATMEDTSTDVCGLYEALDGSLYAVDSKVPGRRIYRLPPGGALVNLSEPNSFGPLAARSLPGTGRPVFAETEAMLVLAGGAEPRKVVFGPPTISALGGAPHATHIVANSSRLLANDPLLNRSQFFFSDQALGSSTTGHETWTGPNAGFITAEARPDIIRALHESTNEIFVFGQTTLQVYSPDATFVYASLPTINRGLAGPYAVITYDQSFAWLDHKRRFVVSNGRSVQDIGAQIQQSMDDLSEVTDVFGYHLRLGAVDCLVWTFPTAGVTFAYQVGGGWAQWSGWTNNNWTRHIVTAHHLADNENWAGLTAGRIGKFSTATQTDLGAPINAYVRTGFLDRGTDRKKHCQRVSLGLKRGETPGSTSPVAWLKFRDDAGDWTGRIPVELGRSGDRSFPVSFRSLGVYRRRQWEFEFAGTDDLEVAWVREEYEVLED